MSLYVDTWNKTTEVYLMKKAKKNVAPGVRQLKKGIYLVRVQRIDPRTGKLADVRRRVRCDSVGEAVMARQALLIELERGEEARERVRLEEYARSWMRGKIPTIKPSTRRTYADALDKHILPDLGSFYLDALRPADVRTWFERKAKTYAPATVNCFLRVLKTVLADAVDELDLGRSPAARIRSIPDRRPEGAEPRNLLTADEMRRFFEVLQRDWPRWHAFVLTQFATATRFGEVSALRWEDVDEERGVIVIRRAHWRTKVSTTKTNGVKEVILHEEVRQVLRDWRRELIRRQHPHVHSGWVFPSRVGKPHHAASCMRKAFIDCLKKIEVDRPFSSHGLRRTANDLLRRVATGEVTRAITGHVTSAMTEHYSHVDAEEKASAVRSMFGLLKATEEDDEDA